MPRQGQQVLREQTKQFIGENPFELVIKRASWEDDGAGGTKPAQWTDLSPQTVRLIPQSMNESLNTDGEAVRVVYVIVAEHDADIKDDDAFIMGGNRFEVTLVQDVNGYEKRAEVVQR